MKKALQLHSKESLTAGKAAAPEEILEFLENFRELHGQASSRKSILISMKVPEALLQAFRHRARLLEIPYQTLIKQIMTEWLATGAGRPDPR